MGVRVHVVLEPILLFFLIVASATDLLWGKVHNALTLPGIALGPILFFGVDRFWGYEASLAILCAIALYFPFWLLGVFKAGDVKLAMVLAAWSSPSFIFQISIASLFAGALVGLI